MNRQLILCSILVLLLCVINCNSINNNPKLILISFDGFRYDYLDNLPVNETQNFQYFIKNGVKAKWIKSVFPTVTWPNHYSLISGLYPETHGIVNNYFYDSHWLEHFVYDSRMDNYDPTWYDVGAEPIYVTNNLAGNNRKSGSLLWPAGLGKVKCVGPDKIIKNADPFTHMKPIERVNNVISWFVDDKDPINLGLMYVDEPDELAHTYGPGSKEVNNFITHDLNDALGHLFKKLKENNLFDSTNIILTADHGFATRTKFVNLDHYIHPSWYDEGSRYRDSVTMQIFPKEGYLETIVQRLMNVEAQGDIYIYRKGGREMTEDLHYNNNIRIAPLILSAAEGVAIITNKTNTTGFNKGMHGYDPNKVKNMRPFFLAMGPAFKKGYVSEGFDNINIYELMCHILGITPAPNNGSLDAVKQMLVATDDSGISPKFTLTAISFVLLVGVSVMAAGIYAICACHNARKKTRFLLPHATRTPGFSSKHEPSNRLLDSDPEDDEEF